MSKKKQKQRSKRVFFSIADSNNEAYFEMLRKSFRHFHPEEELRIVGKEQLQALLGQDPQFFYRATPVIAWNLFNEGYDTVIKIDADSLVLGDLSHTWEGDFDVAVVNNSNPREMKKYPVTVWNIHPLSYINAGYVVMKSPQFVQHWLGLCSSQHFQHYQMREQDLLNIMVFYMNTSLMGPYAVRYLDAGDVTHGLVTRGYEPQMILRDGKVILPKNEEWNGVDKEVVIFHAAGGNLPNKMNLDLMFKDEVLAHIKTILK